jgi:hypothetical protein
VGLIVLSGVVVVILGVVALIGRSGRWRRRARVVSWWLRSVALGYVVTVTVLFVLAVMNGVVDVGVGATGTIRVLGVPVVVAALPLATPLLPTRLQVPALWSVAVVALAGVVVSGLSIGMVYAPAALCVLAAVFVAVQADPSDRGTRSAEPSYHQDG